MFIPLLFLNLDSPVYETLLQVKQEMWILIPGLLLINQAV